jgi:hypothetical protein
MSVKAKFQCNSVEHFEHSKCANLTAVKGNEGEDKDFTKYTPSGQLSISIDESTPAVDFFEPGEAYYLTFDKA